MHDALIVGGGPVGLFLGILLLQEGLDVRILEQRTERSPHSRAIGIHPPALDALDNAGIASSLVSEGIQVRRGIARSRGTDLAELSFDSVSRRFPFVLTVPQILTERLLEQRLHQLSPQALVRGARVEDTHDDGASVGVLAGGGGVAGAGADGSFTYQARLLVAADGARSAIRDRLGIAVSERHYPDTYFMGDFADTTGDGPTAALYLEEDGIVESFPLPGSVRRWVVRTRSFVPEPTVELLSRLIKERTGAGVEPATNTMLSSFQVRSQLARRLVRGRTALIGDAAHEVSPIGGQGMNLGWLDAVELAPIMAAALRGKAAGAALVQFNRRRRRAAVTAARQAHLNMALGRPAAPRILHARNRLLAGAISVPYMNDLVARRFTMQ